jgi:hypothetical protein
MAKAIEPSSAYTAILDDIEKKIGNSQGDMHNFRLSTGVLVVDLIMAGGLVPGMTTIAGEEQSGKSTLLMATLHSALQSKIPIIHYLDCENCLTGDNTVLTDKGEQTFYELFKDKDLTKLGSIEEYVNVITPEGKTAKAKLFYGGVKPITKITTETNHHLSGNNHPILVIQSNGSAIWKTSEQIEVGDRVLVKKT